MKAWRGAGLFSWRRRYADGVADHYATLGVSRSATADEIKSAYRKLARLYHPDVNKAADAQKKFAAAQQAYEVLSDAEKRKLYDQYGDAAFAQGGPGSASGQQRTQWGSGAGGGRARSGRGGAPDIDAEDLGSIFESIFGGGAGGMGGRAGAGGARGGRGQATYDYRDEDEEETVQEVRVDFMTAAKGGTAQVRVMTAQQTFKTIEVKIPAGTEDGAGMRVRGAMRGVAAAGASADLLLRVRVMPHELFRRGEGSNAGKGLDLYLDVPVTIAEATLGASIDVPTMKGTVQLTIPPGSASGKRMKLGAMGIRDEAGRQGDLYVIVQIVPPTEHGISDLEKDVLRRIAGLGGNPRGGAAWGR